MDREQQLKKVKRLRAKVLGLATEVSTLKLPSNQQSLDLTVEMLRDTVRCLDRILQTEPA